MSDPRCKCSMAIAATGDGCRYCQPQEHIDRLGEWLDEEREELTRLQSEVERLRGRCEQAEATVAAVGDAFGIGSEARTRVCLETNAENAARFSRLLHRVEAEFFSVPGEPDEDYPDDEPQPECVLNSWGNTEEQYVRSFGAALLRKQAEAVEACGPKMQAEEVPEAYMWDLSDVNEWLQEEAQRLRQQAAESEK